MKHILLKLKAPLIDTVEADIGRSTTRHSRKKTINVTIIPVPSTYGTYIHLHHLHLVDLYRKCRQICHTWMLWDRIASIVQTKSSKKHNLIQTSAWSSVYYLHNGSLSKPNNNVLVSITVCIRQKRSRDSEGGLFVCLSFWNSNPLTKLNFTNLTHLLATNPPIPTQKVKLPI